MKRKTLIFTMIGAMLLILTGLSAQGEARVGVRVGINIPAYRFAAPPPLVVIPRTYVYVVPDIDVDVLFYDGYWYRPYEGRWFRARSYNGPWAFIPPPRVPHVLLELPPDYRRVPRGYRRIPYVEFRSNWGRWQREKYWERDDLWRRRGW